MNFKQLELVIKEGWVRFDEIINKFFNLNSDIDKPNSKNQRYRLTLVGLSMQTKRKGGL